MEKVFLGLHIPKCAGTSILSELKKNYGDRIYQSTSLISNVREGKSDLLDGYPNLSYEGYFGHHFCDELLKIVGRDVFLFTFVRDPLERALSHYKYINRMNLSVGLPEVEFEQFVETVPSMTGFILDRFPGLTDRNGQGPRWMKAASVLKKFDYVGDSDDLVSFQSVFKDNFGIELDLSVQKNKAPKEVKKIPYDFKEKVYRSLEDDVLLYQWFKQLWREHSVPIRKGHISSYLKTPLNEDRLFNFHASSLIAEFRANNDLDSLRKLKFGNERLDQILEKRLVKKSLK